MLEQALKTVQDLQARVRALEQERAPAAAARHRPPRRRRRSVRRSSLRQRRPSPELPTRQGARRGLRPGDARRDLRLQAHGSRAGARRCRPSKIPVNCPGDPGCGKDGATIFSVRQSSLGVRAFIPTAMGQVKTDLASTCSRPTAATQVHWLQRLGRARPVRRRADLLAVHGHRCVPQHDRLLGTERHGVRAQSAVAIDAVQQRRHEPGVLARSAQLRDRYRQAVAGRPGARRRHHCTQPSARCWRVALRLDRDWGHVQAAGILREVGFQNPTTARRRPVGHAGPRTASTSAVPLKVFGHDTAELAARSRPGRSRAT